MGKEPLNSQFELCMDLWVSQFFAHFGKQYRHFLKLPAQELRVESQCKAV